MPRQLEWTTHAKLGQFDETPDMTARKSDGVPLKIQMGTIHGDLTDKPVVGCDSLYVYLSAFGSRPKTKQDGMGFMYQSPELEQDWNCFKSVQIYTRENGVSVCRFDPENGPLNTPAERLAAVKRSYPVVVAMLKEYAAACFDGYDGQNQTRLWELYNTLMKPNRDEKADVDAMPSSVVMAPPLDDTIGAEEDPVTFVEKFLASTVMTCHELGGKVNKNFTGLTCVDAAVRAIEVAGQTGHPVEMVHNGVWVEVNHHSVVDDVVKYMPTPGNNWPLIEVADGNDAELEWKAGDTARSAALKANSPVILSFRDRKIVVYPTDALGKIQDRIVRH